MTIKDNQPHISLRDHLSRAGRISAAKLSVEERRERARKGGLAAQAKRRAEREGTDPLTVPESEA